MVDRRGVFMGFSAYFLWGLFPIYFQLLARTSAFEIVAYRIIFTLVTCVLLLAIGRDWHQLLRVFKNRRATALLAGAGLLVAFNWALYVWGVNNGFAIDAALGYFINPLVNALFGVLLLGERMRRLQWVAFGIGTLAVLVLVFGYGQVPWVALGLAATFGSYGLVKKTVGRAVPPVPGLALESIASTPFAIAFLVWLSVAGLGTVNIISGYGALVMMAGPITAVPLLLFAAAAARIPLTTMGILQYVAPIMQFLGGWLLIGEQMPPLRWVGFAMIWVAVVVFIVDAVGHARGQRLPAGPSGQ